MSRVGGLTHRFYKMTRGVKVSGGQRVKAGTLITREGHRWKAGQNVIGLSHLNAACDGEIYFTKKRGNYRKTVTYVHVRPVEIKEKKDKKILKSINPKA